MKLKRILEQFEGIILAEYTFGKQSYIEKLCGVSSDGAWIYLRFKTQKRLINQYLAEEISLGSLIYRGSEFSFIYKNMDGSSRVINTVYKRIPEDYLPNNNVFHDKNLKSY